MHLHWDTILSHNICQQDLSIKTISLLGCGWLGHPLAQGLEAQGNTIKVSTTSFEKLSKLKTNHTTPYLLNLPLSSNESSSFFDCDHLIITLPFKRSFTDPFVYKHQIDSIISFIKPSTHVLFTSSTSVYPNTSGIYTETTPIISSTNRQEALLETENMLLNLNNSCIARLAGLYGPNRDIGKFHTLRPSKYHPHSTVNLIHLEDVIELLTHLINVSATGIYNLVSDEHPKREDLYSSFIPNMDALPIQKIVSNKKIKTQFNYTFLHRLV